MRMPKYGVLVFMRTNHKSNGSLQAGSLSAVPQRACSQARVMVMVMNLYSAFSINIFKCALQAMDLWVRSDISIYRCRWQPLSVH